MNHRCYCCKWFNSWKKSGNAANPEPVVTPKAPAQTPKASSCLSWALVPVFLALVACLLLYVSGCASSPAQVPVKQEQVKQGASDLQTEVQEPESSKIRDFWWPHRQVKPDAPKPKRDPNKSWWFPFGNSD